MRFRVNLAIGRENYTSSSRPPFLLLVEVGSLGIGRLGVQCGWLIGSLVASGKEASIFKLTSTGVRTGTLGITGGGLRPFEQSYFAALVQKSPESAKGYTKVK